MPDGPLFSDRPLGSIEECCRQVKGGGGKGWDVPCILKIMCKKDKKVIDQLAKTTVNTADDLYWMDPIFDGKSWTAKKVPGAGSSESSMKLIYILSGKSCEYAADTFYHEIWHQNQKGMDWPEPSEDDAYYNTELWLIERGLKGNPSLRTKDPKTGKVVPDKKAIRKHVQDEYPSPPPPIKGKPQPVPVGADTAKNLTKVRDPVTGTTTWRPSKKGDTYAGPQKEINPKTIDPKAWKCP
jgi:hypothetical protein